MRSVGGENHCYDSFRLPSSHKFHSPMVVSHCPVTSCAIRRLRQAFTPPYNIDEEIHLPVLISQICTLLSEKMIRHICKKITIRSDLHLLLVKSDSEASLRIAIPGATMDGMAPVCPRKGESLESYSKSEWCCLWSWIICAFSQGNIQYSTEVTEPSWPINIARAS